MFWNKDKELIEYAEQEAKILAAFQIECSDALERAGTTLLNILLGGAGGGLALAISLYEKSAVDWLITGTFLTSVYLFVLSGLITWGCLWSRYIYPPGNEPENIYNDRTNGMELSRVKANHLKVRQFCINENRDRNDVVGAWINRVRCLTALTPLFIIVSYLFS